MTTSIHLIRSADYHNHGLLDHVRHNLRRCRRLAELVRDLRVFDRCRRGRGIGDHDAPHYSYCLDRLNPAHFQAQRKAEQQHASCQIGFDGASALRIAGPRPHT